MLHRVTGAPTVSDFPVADTGCGRGGAAPAITVTTVKQTIPIRNSNGFIGCTLLWCCGLDAKEGREVTGGGRLVVRPEEEKAEEAVMKEEILSTGKIWDA